MGNLYTSRALKYSSRNFKPVQKVQDLCAALLLIWDNFKPLQDEWIMKGHTQRN